MNTPKTSLEALRIIHASIAEWIRCVAEEPDSTDCYPELIGLALKMHQVETFISTLPQQIDTPAQTTTLAELRDMHDSGAIKADDAKPEGGA